MARSQPLVRYPAEKIVEAYEHALDPDSEAVLIVVSGLVRSLTARRLTADTLGHDRIIEVFDHDNPALLEAWERARIRMMFGSDENTYIWFFCDRTLGDLSTGEANRLHERNPLENQLTAYTALGGVSRFFASRPIVESDVSPSDLALQAVPTQDVTIDVTQGDHVIVPGVPFPTTLTAVTPHVNTMFIRSSWRPLTSPVNDSVKDRHPHLRRVK